MLYWIGLFGLLIGLISPAVGVLFVIPTSGKILMENPQQAHKFFIGWVVLCVLFYLINLTDTVQTLNLIVGAGLSCFILFHLIKRNLELNQIFMFLLILNTFFIAIRQYLFSERLFSQYNQAADEAALMISHNFAENSEQYLVFMELVEMSKTFYMRYSPGIWISTMMLCLMLGYYLLSRKKIELNSIKYFQTHVYIIYSLVFALVIAVFTENRVYSINYLIALVPLFLIQGLGVIIIKIGKWFRNSKLLIALAVISLVINPYIILFISVVGLFDSWFDFRNLSKSEDLNENHSN